MNNEYTDNSIPHLNFLVKVDFLELIERPVLKQAWSQIWAFVLFVQDLFDFRPCRIIAKFLGFYQLSLFEIGSNLMSWLNPIVFPFEDALISSAFDLVLIQIAVFLNLSSSWISATVQFEIAEEWVHDSEWLSIECLSVVYFVQDTLIFPVFLLLLVGLTTSPNNLLILESIIEPVSSNILSKLLSSLVWPSLGSLILLRRAAAQEVAWAGNGAFGEMLVGLLFFSVWSFHKSRSRHEYTRSPDSLSALILPRQSICLINPIIHRLRSLYQILYLRIDCTFRPLLLIGVIKHDILIKVLIKYAFIFLILIINIFTIWSLNSMAFNLIQDLLQPGVRVIQIVQVLTSLILFNHG